MRLAVWALTLLAMGAGGAGAAESPPVRSARATATLVSEVDAVAPGAPLRVALRLVMAPGWHTYWKNPGDAGIAPEMNFTLPPGVAAGPVAWPVPAVEHEGPLTTYGYTGDLLLPVALTGATGAVPIQLHAEWLVCAKVCVPESGDFRLDLPAGAATPSPQAKLFAAADQAAPRPSPFQARIAPDGTLFVPGLAGATDAWFAADTPDAIAASGAQSLSSTADGLRLTLAPGPAFKAGEALSGLLVVRDAGGLRSALQVVAAPGEVPAAAGLWRLLGLALLGGLILNLMPCVFPILAMKAVGLARLGGGHRRFAALHAASYTAGVLLAFGGLGAGLLALRAAGDTAGWGFQFQSPAFVAVTAWLLFAVGLNLSGVFSVGGRLAGAGQSLAARGGHLGSLFTGLLAVLVATPCTAPFMGAAIAGALSGSPVAGLAVFLAMGLGLAAPYAMLALIPGAARALPRPGRWMDLVKQALAFPVYATAAWLIWVLAREAGPDGVSLGLGGLLLLGVGGWAAGLAQASAARGRLVGYAVAGVAVAGVLAILPAIGGTVPPMAAQADDGSETFSADRLAALQSEGRPVFVDMTAAWCVTCLVNERLALAPAPVRRAFADAHVAYLKGDWTRQDPEITRFLRRHGRDGVPLYVYFPPSGGQPTVLPQILTQGIVLDAIGKAAGQS